MPSLSGFTSALHGGGARANQFQVTMSGTGASSMPSNFHFLCRSAQIPALTIGEVAVPYRGRVVYLAGDRTYDAWTVTIYNDRAFSVRSVLENWMDDMSDIGGTSRSNTLSSAAYYGSATIWQMDRSNNPIRLYTLHGLWPTTVDAIDLSYDANDAVEEFGATFRFNWMSIGGISSAADSAGRTNNPTQAGESYPEGAQPEE